MKIKKTVTIKFKEFENGTVQVTGSFVYGDLAPEKINVLFSNSKDAAAYISKIYN